MSYESLHFSRCPSNLKLFIYSKLSWYIHFLDNSFRPWSIAHSLFEFLFTIVLLSSAIERAAFFVLFLRHCLQPRHNHPFELSTTTAFFLASIHHHTPLCMQSLRKYTMGCLDRLESLKQYFGRLRPAWTRSRSPPPTRGLQIVSLSLGQRGSVGRGS